MQVTSKKATLGRQTWGEKAATFLGGLLFQAKSKEETFYCTHFLEISFAQPPDSSASLRKEKGPPFTFIHGGARATHRQTDWQTDYVRHMEPLRDNAPFR